MAGFSFSQIADAIERPIKAALGATSNARLIALGMVLLSILSLVFATRLEGLAQYVFGGTPLVALVAVIFTRTQQSPALPLPAGEEYLKLLLERGVLYEGSSGKPIRLADIPLLPPPKRESVERRIDPPPANGDHNGDKGTQSK